MQISSEAQRERWVENALALKATQREKLAYRRSIDLLPGEIAEAVPPDGKELCAGCEVPLCYRPCCIYPSPTQAYDGALAFCHDCYPRNEPPAMTCRKCGHSHVCEPA